MVKAEKADINLSETLKMYGLSVNTYAEGTGWDRRTIIHWCKNGIPAEMGQAVYNTFRLWNALWYSKPPKEKEKAYTKRKAPNQPSCIYKYELKK